MTYFRMGNPHYHRRAAVSRSCSGWEGVGPAGYGRQALRARGQRLAIDDCRAAGLVMEEVKVWVRLIANTAAGSGGTRSVMGSSRTGY